MVEGAGTSKGLSLDAVLLIPTAMAGFMFLAIASAIASGGGRELLHREHAVIYPVSPTTDHLGALLLAPLNIAWLLQAWILMGITAYGVERRSLLVGRDRHRHLDRGRHRGRRRSWRGRWRRSGAPRTASRPSARSAWLLAAAAVLLQLTHNTIGLLDSLKTRWIVVGYVDGFRWRWVESIGGRAGAARGRRRARRDPGPPRRPPRRRATSCGSRPAATWPAGSRARRWPCWCAPTGARSGAPCPCAAASPSWRSGPASSRWPAT